MSYETLITPEELRPHLNDPLWVVVDCRFDLLDTTNGEYDYLKAHIPRAVYAHLERDLSATPTGVNGRHPLPTPEELSDVFTNWGIESDVQVVAYDDSGGPFASRLWWCLRYLGHKNVAVINGGFPVWVRLGLPTCSGEEMNPPKTFIFQIQNNMHVDVTQVLEHVNSADAFLIDARAPERYRGEEEPYDPVAGHIPGAVNHYWSMNLNDEDQFLPPEILRSQFKALLDERSPQSIIGYCGSGVTSCHNFVAMAHAGFDGVRLYSGSWSEWCSDPIRPVATGAEPTPDIAII